MRTNPSRPDATDAPAGAHVVEAHEECDPDTVTNVKKNKKKILENVQVALTEVSDAVTDLDKLLKDLTAAPRAEKTTISKVVEAAFSRLKHARAALADTQKTLESEADDD